ncbi:MAG: hypothetical protein IJI07_01150 [Flexilinea sp.]|nr:hypothetical protein [Flexilinea sp.]
MTDPLAGFVLFHNEQEVVQLTIGRGYVRISSDALHLIGDPTHICVFFDEAGKRMAVKAADSKMQNTFNASYKTGIGKCNALLQKILDVSEAEWHPGEVIKFNGQRCGVDYVIFDLKRQKVTKFDNHVTAMNKKRAKKEAA